MRRIAARGFVSGADAGHDEDPDKSRRVQSAPAM
jgi:hypothetical protein